MKRKQGTEQPSLIRSFQGEIGERLEGAGYNREAIETAIDDLARYRFYSVASILASDPTTGKIVKDRAVDEFVEQLAKKTRVALESDDLALLKELYQAISKNDADETKRLLANPRVRELAVNSLAKGYNFPIKEAREAFELMDKGIYKQDLVGVTRMTLQLGNEVPEWFPTLIPKRAGLKAIASAFHKDGMDHYFLGQKILRDLKNKRVPSIKDRDIGVLDDTLRALTDNMESLDDLFDWSANILNFPSVQVSIALYSSLHGVPLKTEEVVALQKSFAERDLQPLIARLMTRITDEAKDFLWLA